VQIVSGDTIYSSLIIISHKDILKEILEKQEMNLQNNKTLSSIALILILTVSAIIVSMPAANAHSPALQIPTWSYISVSPSIIGVNQQLLIVMWLNDYPWTAVGAYGDRWDGYTIQITKPDGTQQTLGPFTSDPVGSWATTYIPSQTGEYKFVFKFPGDTLTGLPVPPAGYYFGGGVWINDTYLPSQSDPVFVTVQQTPIEGYQETPLPTDYWTRPINGANRDWYKVAGNWLGLTTYGHNYGRINEYSEGPGSAHIMWVKQYWDGGIMGGETGDVGYYTGMSYETFGLFPPIILNGRLYYNVQTPPRDGWYCVDLRTGETLFFHNTTGPIAGQTQNYPVSGNDFDFSGALVKETLSFGQIYDYESPNQHGGLPYLWSTGQMGSVFGGTGASTKWDMFDAFTGNYICSIANVSQIGAQVVSRDGSILFYNIAGAGANTRLTVWNTSRVIWYRTAYTGNQYWMWRPYWNVTFDGNNGFSLNVTIPAVQGGILAVVEGQYVIGGTSGKNNGTFVQQGNLWALNLQPGQEGLILWNRTYTPPLTVANDYNGGVFAYGKMTGPFVDAPSGIFHFYESLTRRRWVFDLETMQQLWVSAPEEQWQFYTMSTSIYRGKLLSYGYTGVLIAYDLRTGKVLWNWTSGTVGFEGYYENTPLNGLACIADGKIYLYTSEHSPSQPLRRDANLWCVDTETGKLVWKIQCWANNPAIADGYIVTLNSFDNQIYCFGKGPSATTVTAEPSIVAKGSSVMIKGTVTDQSAGAKGTPAISDADQENWMEYLYQQRPIPGDAKGVPVILTALDPNGNSQNIGTATSDLAGNFGIMYTPPVEGQYTIMATFAGSEAYGSSYATTYMGVGKATAQPQPISTPAPTPPPTATPPTVTPSPQVTTTPIPPPSSPGIPTTYIVIAVVAIIIVVAAAALALRRRK
jgi:hypothetical protein